MSHNKGFANGFGSEKRGRKKSQNPIVKLAQEYSGARGNSRIERFLRYRWTEFSALAWKGYLEMGRGALCLTIDELILAGGASPVEYIDERSCFYREIMSGLWPMGEISQKVNTYLPEREVAVLLKWRGRRGYLVAAFRDYQSTPIENYERLGLQADKNKFPLALGVTDKQAAENASVHPLGRLMAEQWDLFAAVAWQGYLKEGRGILAVFLGQGFFTRMEQMENDLTSTDTVEEIPITFLSVQSEGMRSYLESCKSKAEEILTAVNTYDPHKSIYISFEWDYDDSPVLQFTMSTEEAPRDCYEKMKARLDEFTEVK